MKFNSTHNGAIIEIEYDEIEASDDLGQVYNCEVFYNGALVTDLLINSYEAFLMECEQHFAQLRKVAMEASQYDAGQAKYESRVAA